MAGLGMSSLIGGTMQQNGVDEQQRILREQQSSYLSGGIAEYYRAQRNANYGIDQGNYAIDPNYRIVTTDPNYRIVTTTNTSPLPPQQSQWALDLFVTRVVYEPPPVVVPPEEPEPDPETMTEGRKFFLEDPSQ